MKTNKVILVFILVIANLLSFAQLKVLSTGKVAVGGGTDNNAAMLNISDTQNSTIYSKVIFSQGWGEAIKSEVNRTDAIAYSAVYNGNSNFMVFGNGDIWGDGTHITGSDSILKYDIKNVVSASEILRKLQGVTYKKKSDEKNIAVTHIGLIAQDVKKVIPEIVYQKEKGGLGIAYEELIPLLIEAIKEQQIQIERLTAQINDCCTNNNSLKSASVATEATTDLANNKASLDQNIPNPFSRETQIGCYIPEGSGPSVLYIYNMNGNQLQQYIIKGKGKQSVTINSNSLEPGMYLYALVIEGKEVDTKRMILTK